MNEALRQAAENAADVLDEARTYVGCESWSPSMLEECERALRMLRAALAQPPAPTAQPAAYWIPKAEQFCIAKSGERPFAKAWEPLYAQPVQQPGAEPDGRLHTDGYFTWKRRDGYVLDAKLPCDFYLAAPAQRQPLSDEQIDSLTFPFLTAELGPTAYDPAIARAVEAAHGITAAPAAQKGEKL